MKKTFIILIVVILVLTVFTGTALADKPADKPNKGSEQGEDVDDPEGEEGPKKPNEKRDAKKAFREQTRPLIDEIHANREEWGMLGDDQDGIDELIEAQIDAMELGGAELSPEQIALIKEKILQIKALKVQMRDFKRVIHMNWKQYIAAKKASDIDAAMLALNNLIAIQELRIEIRGQIVTIMNEIAAALGIVVEPAVPEVPAA